MTYELWNVRTENASGDFDTSAGSVSGVTCVIAGT
jgi:hypothetical protein